MRVCARAPARVFAWTLDHQLISHTDRHQRGFELTLRVHSVFQPQFHVSPPPHQVDIHIEMKQMEFCPPPRRSILGCGKIKLQTSGNNSVKKKKKGKCLQVVRLSVITSDAEVFMRVSCFFFHPPLIKAGQVAFRHCKMAPARFNETWLRWFGWAANQV